VRETLLTLRPSFETAALFASWTAIAVLVLVTVNLHARLRRLERARGAEGVPQPFARLVGRPLDAAAAAPTVPPPHAVLFLSSACPACTRILEELRRDAWDAPLALAWIDGPASPPPPLPPTVAVLADGERLSAELGIRVAPFAVLVDPNGLIERAAPVGSLAALAELAGARAQPARDPQARLLKEVTS
jgi:hypothetical protein